ncbi:acetyl-CoA synthetase-like protein [Penicillium cf. griseofulvum]|nr:acetyl-CoA synthetase-like protein [Penicillium cf. griseofulvum]
MNVQRMLEVQNVALERRLENITRMVEDIEIAQAQKTARRARLTQQNYEAEQRRIERAQRNQQEREKAEQRRIEKAQRNQQQRYEAEQRRIEKTKRSRHDLDVAQNERIERAKGHTNDPYTHRNVSANLGSHDSAQVAVEIVSPQASSNNILVAFISFDDLKSISLNDEKLLTRTKAPTEGIREKLATQIPSYMVPSVYIPIIVFPTTATGKTDRRRLREMASTLTL